MSKWLLTKPLDHILAESEETGEGTLRRTLSASNLVALGIGAIIGTGIFVLAGSTAANYAGPAVVYSFIFAAVACVFAGLCYAEFSAMIPVAGSAYTYGYATLGELFAWIIGWDLILEYAFGAATVCSGWSGYVLSLGQDMGLRLPPALAGTPGSIFVLYQGHWEYLGRVAAKLAAAGIDPATLPQKHGVFNLVAFCGIMFATSILIIGIKESARFNNFIVAVKLMVLFFFIGYGGYWLYAHPHLMTANWHPFVPPNTGTFGWFGWSGTLRGAGVIFFAYIGFDAVSTAAQESKNPKRDMPLGILGSLVICTILYILVALVLTGLVNYRYLNVPDSLALGMEMTGFRWGSLLVKIGALGGLTSTMIVMLLGQSRVFFSMSKDGLLPRAFSHVHPRFRTPWISSLTVGLVVATFASLIPLGSLGQMCSIGTLLAFIIVCAGVWVLRKKNPDQPRPFRAPWMPFTPLMGIGVSLALMLGLPWETWMRLVVWLVVGLVIYFLYGRHHSREQILAAGGKPTERVECPVCSEYVEHIIGTHPVKCGKCDNTWEI
jgi:APA family basic amino acid/polyamine antiporter